MGIKRNDILWKGALEDFFRHFLCMIFPDANKIFDFPKGFTFLEQELAEISSSADVKHPKIIDKLVGVHLLEGGQLWVRVHVEVESKSGKAFGRRMFRYFSRIFDKHEPVISIAIFLEKAGKNNMPVYRYSHHGTSVEFKFNTVYVAELNDQELEQSDNPFAKLLLIAKLATNKNLAVQQVFEKKKDIARQLFALNLPNEEIRRLLDFLKAYVHFDDKAISNKFDAEIALLTQKTETMGITEQILSIAEEQGVEKGLKLGAVRQKKMVEEISKNLLKQGIDIRRIHEATSMPIQKLQKLQQELR